MKAGDSVELVNVGYEGIIVEEISPRLMKVCVWDTKIKKYKTREEKTVTLKVIPVKDFDVVKHGDVLTRKQLNEFYVELALQTKDYDWLKELSGRKVEGV